MESPGELFPSSWISGHEITRHKKGAQLRDLEAGSLQPGMLVPRYDYRSQATAFKHMLKISTPIFDKTVEDGTRFRIYRSGTIEVRTLQAYNEEEETIQGVFAIQAPNNKDAGSEGTKRRVRDQEKLVKVTLFVERDPLDTSSLSQKFMPSRRYYVVAQTDAHNTIVTEKLHDGTIILQENPAELQDRNSLAKTVWSKAKQFSTTVADLKLFQTKEMDGSNTSCKMYSYGAYDAVLGTTERDDSSVPSPSPVTAPVTAPQHVPKKAVQEKFVYKKPLNDKTNIKLLMQANSRNVLPVNGQNDEHNKQLLKQASRG